jgi:hypothetical protein
MALSQPKITLLRLKLQDTSHTGKKGMERMKREKEKKRN